MTTTTTNTATKNSDDDETADAIMEAARDVGCNLVSVIGTSEREEMARRLQVAAASLRGLYAFEGEAIDQVHELVAVIASKLVIAGEPASHQRILIEVCADILETVVQVGAYETLFEAVDEDVLGTLSTALLGWLDTSIPVRRRPAPVTLVDVVTDDEETMDDDSDDDEEHEEPTRERLYQ